MLRHSKSFRQKTQIALRGQYTYVFTAQKSRVDELKGFYVNPFKVKGENKGTVAEYLRLKMFLHYLLQQNTLKEFYKTVIVPCVKNM